MCGVILIYFFYNSIQIELSGMYSTNNIIIKGFTFTLLYGKFNITKYLHYLMYYRTFFRFFIRWTFPPQYIFYVVAHWTHFMRPIRTTSKICYYHSCSTSCSSFTSSNHPQELSNSMRALFCSPIVILALSSIASKLFQS